MIMRKLIESTYLSLDGKIGGESFWATQSQFRDDRHVAYNTELLDSAEAMVLGRATYEVFAATWPGQTDAFATKFNALPKHVATHADTELTWNAQRLPGDAVAAVGELKQAGSGTLIKYGTGSFSQALLDGGQLDELHLWIFPFVAGAGDQLLPGVTRNLDLVQVTEVGNGAVVLTYTPK
ncbi:dihydrofolate reductase family protein [Microlunatus sp. GCM10028923]|uniref:dihydrofolate reductase family protein n=1 Tax=Microlunatus sp. GCM10028923 TaxID=3273400 RepID=UPI00361A1B19